MTSYNYSILIFSSHRNYLLKRVSKKQAELFVLDYKRKHPEALKSLYVEHENKITLATEFFKIPDKIQQGHTK